MAIVPRLLLLCLTAAATSIARAQPDSSGFISIDCGLPGQTGYVDSTTTLSYTTDAGFIDVAVGINRNISGQYITPSMPKSLYNVCSFPSVVRNCYTISSLVSGLKYLIRGKFLYGNYDGLNRLPIFDLYIGVNFWATVNISASNAAVYAEAITVLLDNFVQVCLVNTNGGVPFISGLDLRPLTNTLYPQANATQAMVLLHRVNFGPTNSNTVIRYPDDLYDRIWFPFVDVADWAEISTEMKVSIVDGMFDPPEAVMQTAITPRNVSQNIEFTLDLESFPSDRLLGYVFMMYFSELQQLRSSALRQFYIYINDVPWGSTLTGSYAYTPRYLTAVVDWSSDPYPYSQLIVSLRATANSTLPPIINAMELFAVISSTTMGTDSQDGASMP